MARPLTTLAPAKVNLTLTVHGRRGDGYHLLESLVVFTVLGDRVCLEPAMPPEVLVVGGPFARDIVGENLLVRTLRLVGERHPELRLGRVSLEKNLPVAAGIGGGSSDAGALLRLLRAVQPEQAGAVDWSSLALELGADVPVALYAQPCLMSGIGERLAPVDGLPRLSLVLVNPCEPVPATKTRDVFRVLGAMEITDAPLPVAPAPASLMDYLTARGNDLTPAATTVVPAITTVLGALTDQPGCRLARLSGAGPTCFGLFSDDAEATRAAARLAISHPQWWIAATETLSSPVSCVVGRV